MVRWSFGLYGSPRSGLAKIFQILYWRFVLEFYGGAWQIWLNESGEESQADTGAGEDLAAIPAYGAVWQEGGLQA